MTKEKIRLCSPSEWEKFEYEFLKEHRINSYSINNMAKMLLDLNERVKNLERRGNADNSEV